MRRISALLLVALLGCGGQDEAELPAPNFDAVPEAARQSAEAALERFNSAPQDATAAGDLAMWLDAYGQDEAAAAYYSRAAQRQPRAIQWVYLRGGALQSAGRTEDAMASYREAVALQAGYAPARLRLADLLAEADQPQEAEELYLSVLEIARNSAAAETGLGRLALSSGDYETAVQRLERAVSIAPSNPAALEALKDGYQTLNDAAGLNWIEARIQRAAASSPHPDPLTEMMESLVEGDESLHLERGKSLERQGDLVAAIAEYEKALEANPESGGAAIGLMSISALRGKFEEAEEHYQLAVERSADPAELNYHLGVLRSIQKRYGEAAEAYRQSLAADPDNADALSNLGYALELTGRDSEAQDKYRAALGLNPLHRLANLHYGRIALKAGRAQEAEEPLRRAALVEDQQTPQILNLLADAQRKLGRNDDAARNRERARRMAADMNISLEEQP